MKAFIELRNYCSSLINDKQQHPLLIAVVIASFGLLLLIKQAASFGYVVLASNTLGMQQRADRGGQMVIRTLDGFHTIFGLTPKFFFFFKKNFEQKSGYQFIHTIFRLFSLF